MGKSRKRTKLSHSTGYPYKTVKPGPDKGSVQLHEQASFAGDTHIPAFQPSCLSNKLATQHVLFLESNLMLSYALQPPLCSLIKGVWSSLLLMTSSG